MLREIYEQPRAIADTIAHYFDRGRLDPAAFQALIKFSPASIAS